MWSIWDTSFILILVGQTPIHQINKQDLHDKSHVWYCKHFIDCIHHVDVHHILLHLPPFIHMNAVDGIIACTTIHHLSFTTLLHFTTDHYSLIYHYSIYPTTKNPPIRHARAVPKPHSPHSKAGPG